MKNLPKLKISEDGLINSVTAVIRTSHKYDHEESFLFSLKENGKIFIFAAFGILRILDTKDNKIYCGQEFLDHVQNLNLITNEKENENFYKWLIKNENWSLLDDRFQIFDYPTIKVFNSHKSIYLDYIFPSNQKEDNVNLIKKIYFS